MIELEAAGGIRHRAGKVSLSNLAIGSEPDVRRRERPSLFVDHFSGECDPFIEDRLGLSRLEHEIARCRKLRCMNVGT